MKLSVVLPAYNESGNIVKVLNELTALIAEVPQVDDYEIWLIDDHSSDNTFGLVRDFPDDKCNSLRLSKRSGSHTAIRAGLEIVTGDAVLCISADGQDNPGVIKEMIQKLINGSQVIWAIREDRDEPFYIKLFAALFYRLLKWLTKSEIGDINISNADFYLLDRKIIEAINVCPERNTSVFGLILWLGFKQDYVNYERRERFSGASKWNFRSRMRLAKDWVIAFSGIPLKVMSIIGVVIAVLGFLYSLFIIVFTLLGYSSPGWSETAVLILVIGGTQMTMLGVIGEYLWRNLDETRSRPLYFIEDITKDKSG